MKVTNEMVNRFLSWSLPDDFSPDCGISFDKRPPDARGYVRQWPVGTNLLTATQAREMLEHVLGALESFQWIPVSERLPADDVIVPVVDANGYQTYASQNSGYANWRDQVRHCWMDNVVKWYDIPIPPAAQ